MRNAGRACYAHPKVMTRALCDGCSRPICGVCSFAFGPNTLCVDCANSGRTVHDRRQTLRYAVGSIGLAALGVAVVLWAMLRQHAEGSREEAVDAIVGTLMIGSVVGGLALGLIGRDEARRLGSPLAVIGIVANTVLLVLLVVLMVVGLQEGG